MRLLIVCTANACRSIMAEALLAARLGSATVRSAGLQADGRGPDPLALAALADLGVTATVRPSRRLERADVTDADLILGLARHHVRDVVVLDREAFGRTFVLGEIVALAATIGPLGDGEALGDWLARLHEGRSTTDLLDAESPFDIADPTGGPSAGYAATARELDLLTHQLAGVLRPSAPEPPAASAAALATPHRDGPALVTHDAVHVVADRVSRSVAESLPRPSGSGLAVDLVDDWQEAGERASALAGTTGAYVVCLTDEPHGAALIANRSPSARAVVVTNPGIVARVRRRLDANILCVPSALPPSAVAAILRALQSPLPAGPESPSE